MCTLLVSGLAAVAHAGQPPAASADDMAALRTELARLREDVAQLRAEVSALRQGGTSTVAPAADAASSQPSVEAALALVQAQVAEQAQTKVESASRLPVKIFGTIHSSTSLNSGAANWLESPNLVGGADEDGGGGSFSSTLRQSRIGVMLDGLTVGSMRASGVLAWDFFGGVPGFQTGQVMGLPRLLYAFSRLEWARTAIEVGQDEMVLAPRNPTSLAAFSFPDLFRSGNLYLRVPQIRVEHTVAAGAASRFTIAGAIVSPIAGDFPGTYTFVPPALAGERTKRPAVQARAAFAAGAADKPAFALGVSAHYGQQDRGAERLDSWATAVDFDANAGRFGTTGEFFVGEHVPQFGGAMGQLARSRGGFLEGRVALTDRVTLAAGGGMDDASRTVTGPLALDRNRSGFGNLTFHITPELAASFEYRYLVTRGAGDDDRRNHHFNWVLSRSF